MDNMRKAFLVGNAVKGICEKNVIGRVFHNLPDVQKRQLQQICSWVRRRARRYAPLRPAQ